MVWGLLKLGPFIYLLLLMGLFLLFFFLMCVGGSARMSVYNMYYGAHEARRDQKRGLDLLGLEL